MHGRCHVNICQALVPCGVKQPHRRRALQRNPHSHSGASHAVHGVVFVQTAAEGCLRGKKICVLQTQLHLPFRIKHGFSNNGEKLGTDGLTSTTKVVVLTITALQPRPHHNRP